MEISVKRVGFGKLAGAFAASTIGEERSWRISGEVAALPNDAREAVSSAIPESDGERAELAWLDRDSTLTTGSASGAGFLSVTCTHS